MSSEDQDVIERLYSVAQGFEMPPAAPVDDVRRGRRRVRRNRTLATSAAAAVVAGVLGATAAVGGLDRGGSDGLGPIEQPDVGLVDGAPVWYDANGLHRGDVVEKTPIKIGQEGLIDTLTGALALVRSGAVYLDPATGDVWFHPWGGDPRMVGHDSEAGPGGDPNGDTAVWFEGSDADTAGPGELVVYDTAAGREISRTRQSHGVGWDPSQLLAPGNAFLQVSAERVVWAGDGEDLYSHDVRSRTTSAVKAPGTLESLDVHGQIEVFWEEAGDASNVVLRVPGRADERFPGLSPGVRLSPSGNYLLGVDVTETVPAAVMIDTRTGELWRLPKTAHPLIAWSYGDIAMVDPDGRQDSFIVDRPEGELLACDAARRTCERLPFERGFLLPTN